MPAQGRPYHRHDDPEPELPGSDPASAPAGPGGHDPPDRRGRGVPRPARARPARERAAGPQRAMDLPHGRSGRRPRIAGRRPGPVRGRPPPRGASRSDGPRSRRTRRRSSAAWSVSSATTSARSSNGCPLSPRPTRTCRRCGSALHDWVVAWDRRTGHAWIGGRALDGDGRRLARRLDDVHARLTDAGTRRRAGQPESMPAGPLVFHSGPRPSRIRGRRDRRPRAHRARRPVPGQPDPAPRDPVRWRSVAALPAPPDRRPVAVLGVSRPRRRAADRAAAGAPVGVAGAVPVGRCDRRRQDRPDQGHAPARARRAPRTGRSPASSCRAPRIVPRT